MHHRIKPVRGKEFIQGLAVADIGHMELWTGACYALNTRHHLALAVAQIVHDHGGITRVDQLHADVAADVTGASGYQYRALLRHNKPSIVYC